MPPQRYSTSVFFTFKCRLNCNAQVCALCSALVIQHYQIKILDSIYGAGIVVLGILMNACAAHHIVILISIKVLVSGTHTRHIAEP
jgi:hypothetical protein